MLYKSTRSNIEISSSEAIVKGIASDGGLFIPKEFPIINVENFLDLSYQELAIEIFKLFLSDFTEDEIKSSVNSAYDDKFENKKIAPNEYFNNHAILELFHGPTLAFKDMALSVLPYLMKKASLKIGNDDEIVILTATSGDTGKAALEGFSDIEGVKIIVFYPSDGISDIQKHQMITQEGENTYVFAIKGNFDDAQSAVKEIFIDEKLKEELKRKNYIFSSANSINIGRLIPQIVYYIYGYLDLVKTNKIKLNEKINVVVPTGNFGNILAARYAKEIGLPINKFICASNENNVLTDFINTGEYDLKRNFKITNSPSMDILISSNLERFLSLIGNNTREYMEKLKTEKYYSINKTEKEKMNDFYGGFASEKDTVQEIKKTYSDDNYLLDTHTAVAKKVYRDYVNKTNDNTYTMIVSTASPYKFTKSVLEAIDSNVEKLDDFQLIEVLNKKTNINIPNGIKDIANKKIRHNEIIDKNSIKATIENILR